MKKIILFIVVTTLLLSIITAALTKEERSKIETYYFDKDKNMTSITTIENRGKFVVISFNNSDWRVITTKKKFDEVKNVRRKS